MQFEYFVIDNFVLLKIQDYEVQFIDGVGNLLKSFLTCSNHMYVKL